MSYWETHGHAFFGFRVRACLRVTDVALFDASGNLWQRSFCVSFRDISGFVGPWVRFWDRYMAFVGSVHARPYSGGVVVQRSARVGWWSQVGPWPGADVA